MSTLSELGSASILAAGQDSLIPEERGTCLPLPPPAPYTSLEGFVTGSQAVPGDRRAFIGLPPALGGRGTGPGQARVLRLCPKLGQNMP